MVVQFGFGERKRSAPPTADDDVFLLRCRADIISAYSQANISVTAKVPTFSLTPVKREVVRQLVVHPEMLQQVCIV